MDTRTMQDKFVTQAAFGRPFRLGNLYDYRTDNVLSGSYKEHTAY